MNKPKQSGLGPVCVIASAVLFGMMPLFTKITYAYGCTVYTAGAGRFFFGAVALALVICFSPKLSFHVTRQQLLRIFWLSIPFCATTLLLYGSYNSISSGLATTLHFTYPITVMILGALVFHMRLQPKQVLCTLICIAGIFCLYRPGQSAGLQGVIFALLSGVTYSAYILLLGKSHLKQLPVLTISFWMSVFSFAEMMFAAVSGGNLVLPNTWQPWLAMAGLGLTASFAAVALFQFGVFLCGEVRASLLSTFEPLTGVVIGILVFQESMTPLIAVGILLILFAAALLVISPKTDRKETQHGKPA